MCPSYNGSQLEICTGQYRSVVNIKRNSANGINWSCEMLFINKDILTYLRTYLLNQWSNNKKISSWIAANVALWYKHIWYDLIGFILQFCLILTKVWKFTAESVVLHLFSWSFLLAHFTSRKLIFSNSYDIQQFTQNARDARDTVRRLIAVLQMEKRYLSDKLDRLVRYYRFIQRFECLISFQFLKNVVIARHM